MKLSKIGWEIHWFSAYGWGYNKRGDNIGLVNIRQDISSSNDNILFTMFRYGRYRETTKSEIHPRQPLKELLKYGELKLKQMLNN